MHLNLMIAAASLAVYAPACAQDASPSGSLLARRSAPVISPGARVAPHALRQVSLFAIPPIEPRVFQKHDLVQIVVRETSAASSKHELETEKTYGLDGAIPAWPAFNLSELLQLQIDRQSASQPVVQVDFDKSFEGEGEYKREDDLTARLTAEVIEILPNGNLILEGRTMIKNDEEELSIKITGICRPDDITAANSILSNQIHDLKIEKAHEGELKKTSEKGIIAEVMDFIFAF